MISIIPFSKLIISTSQQISNLKNATGLMQNWEDLISDNVIRQIQKNHNGCFAYLAFNSTIDQDLTKFIASGALSAETGTQFIILYCVNTTIESPTVISIQHFEDLLQINSKLDLNFEILKNIFGETETNLPGLILFDNIANSKKTIYVPLINAKYYNKIDYLRKINTIVLECLKKKQEEESIIDIIGKKFSLCEIEYIKNERYTFSENAIKIFFFLKRIKSDLISVFV